MLIDRLQSLIAVIITLIGFLLAIPASKPYSHPEWLNRTHQQSNNKSLNKKSHYRLIEEGIILKEEVGDHSFLSSRRSQEYLDVVGIQEDCCPSKSEMTEPMGGINTQGLYVKLYSGNDSDSDGNSRPNRQRFHEVSCMEDVVDKPCQFVKRKLYNSTCVQQYSFSYAVVHELDENVRRKTRHHHHLTDDGTKQLQLSFLGDNKVYNLDYIRVRSGCACMVQRSEGDQQQMQRQRRRKAMSKGVEGGSAGGGGKRSQQ